MPVDFRNPEERFAAYVDARALRWGYEQKLDGRNPDFRVDIAVGPVICEVHEFRESDNLRSCTMDPCAYIRRTIREKSDQGRSLGEAPVRTPLSSDATGSGLVPSAL